MNKKKKISGVAMVWMVNLLAKTYWSLNGSFPVEN